MAKNDQNRIKFYPQNELKRFLEKRPFFAPPVFKITQRLRSFFYKFLQGVLVKISSIKNIKIERFRMSTPKTSRFSVPFLGGYFEIFILGLLGICDFYKTRFFDPFLGAKTGRFRRKIKIKILLPMYTDMQLCFSISISRGI